MRREMAFACVKTRQLSIAETKTLISQFPPPAPQFVAPPPPPLMVPPPVVIAAAPHSHSSQFPEEIHSPDLIARLLRHDVQVPPLQAE